jgi:hypothetical protein
MTSPPTRGRAGKGAKGAVKVLFVAGSGRSGSTILERTLGQIPGFFSAGEVLNIWERGLVARRKCGCGLPVPDCPVWSGVLRSAFGEPVDVDVAGMAAARRRRMRAFSTPAALARGRGREDPEYERALERLYLAIHECTGSRVIVDSSKSPVYARLLATLPAIDLYLIHLVRDPRAAAYSWRREKTLPDFDDERLMMRQSPITTARRWMKWQLITEALWASRRGRYLRLGYEGLVTSPRSVFQSVLDLIEETAELPLTGERTVALGHTHSVSGNPNRFSTGPVELRVDDEWIRAMSPADFASVTALTWPLLRRYGYPFRRRADPVTARYS